MTDVALNCAYAVGAVNAVVGVWGTWLWWRVEVGTHYWTAVRVAQVACGVQALVAGILWLSGHHHGDTDHDDLHNPGHGPHRAIPKIHQFTPRRS